MNSKKMKETKHQVWSFSFEGSNKYVFVENAFSKTECEKIIEIGKSNSLIESKIGDTKTRNIKEIRDSNISWINPTENTNWMYKKISDIILQVNASVFNYDLFGIGESIQFTEYNSPGGKYDIHHDCMENYLPRKLSFSLQLTDPKNYSGGDLKLHYGGEPVVAPKKQGTVILFPSYNLHEVTPVTKGTRHSLVAWVTGPNFK